MNEVRISESSSSYSSNIPLSGMTSGGISVSPPQSTPTPQDNNSWAAAMFGTVVDVVAKEKEILRKIDNLEDRQKNLEDVLSRQKTLNDSFRSLLRLLYVLSFMSVGLFCGITFITSLIVHEGSIVEKYVSFGNTLSLVGLLGLAIAICPCVCAYDHGKKIDDLNRDLERIKDKIDEGLKK